MATRILDRSTWTDARNGSPSIKRAQTEVYIHYPGSPGTIGVESQESTARRLRGYRSLHVGQRGWSEIAYNWAVDQAGRIWELRGKRQCGGNGGTTSNRRGQAILVIVGNSEQPTAAAIAGIQACIAMIRDWQPSARKIRGHRDSPDASTACPGDVLYRHVKAGTFEPGSSTGKATAGKTPAKAKPRDDGRLEVDSRFGTSTVKALQRFLNDRGAKLDVDGSADVQTWIALQEYLRCDVIDGEVSNQSYKPAELGTGISSGWDYDGRGAKGSEMVKALQKWIHVEQDGIWYESTTKALQLKLREHGA